MVDGYAPLKVYYFFVELLSTEVQPPWIETLRFLFEVYASNEEAAFSIVEKHLDVYENRIGCVFMEGHDDWVRAEGLELIHLE